MYNVFPYFVSKNVTEIPVVLLTPMLMTLIIYFIFDFEKTPEQFLTLYLILMLVAIVAQSLGYMISSMFESPQLTMAVGPLFIMPLILFGGLMSNNDAQFEWLAWIQYISPFKYGAEAIIYNELRYDKHNVRDGLTKQIDYTLGLSKCIGIMCAMTVFLRVMAYLFFVRLAGKA